MNGNGDGGFSYTYIISSNREHTDIAIIWAIFQVNVMKYVANRVLQTKTTVFITIFICVVNLFGLWSIKFDYTDYQEWC